MSQLPGSLHQFHQEAVPQQLPALEHGTSDQNQQVAHTNMAGSDPAEQQAIILTTQKATSLSFSDIIISASSSMMSCHDLMRV